MNPIEINLLGYIKIIQLPSPNDRKPLNLRMFVAILASTVLPTFRNESSLSCVLVFQRLFCFKYWVEAAIQGRGSLAGVKIEVAVVRCVELCWRVAGGRGGSQDSI